MIIVDPKGDDYSKYKDANVITPNFKEFCQATLKSHKLKMIFSNLVKIF